MDAFGNVPAEELWYFAPVTADDKSGYLWIAGILGLVYVITFTVGRLLINRATLKISDWVSLAASLFGVLEYACLFVAIKAGVGRETGDVDRARANKAIYAMFIFFIVAHSVAKVSMALLSSKLFKIYWKKTCLANIAFAAAWGPVVLVIILPLWRPDCSDAPFSKSCSPGYARFIAIAVLDVISELILLIIPIVSLWDLNMPRSAKSSVMSIFASRLLSVVPFFTSMVYIRNIQTGQPSASIPTIGVIQVALTISLVTTNASALRSLTRPMKSVLGGSGYAGYRYGDAYMQPTVMSKSRTMRTGNKSQQATGAFGSIQVQTEIQLETE